MIVDIHVHPKLIKGDPGSGARELEKLLDCMDRAGIDKANLMPEVVKAGGSIFFPGKEEILFSARFLEGAMKTHAERFYSMIWVNVNLDAAFLKDIVREYILGGPINGIKLWAEMNAADEKMDAFAGFLEEHDVPVLFHTWNNTLGRTFFESTPSDIAHLARRHPGLRIIMAHLRGCRFRGVQEVKKLPNVWVDTSGSELEDGYMDYAIRALGPERILFGTDYAGRDFAAARGRIDSVDIAPALKEKIYGGNAVNFFRRESYAHSKSVD